MAKSYKRTILGKVLLNKDLITEKQLNNAYQIQADTGERLSLILIRNKMVAAIEVYKILADLSDNLINDNLPFKIKEMKDEIDFEFSRQFRPSFLNQKLFVPISYNDDIIKIAVYDFKDKTIDNYLKNKFGDILIEKVEISKNEIIYLIEYIFKNDLLESKKNLLKNQKRETALNVFTRGQILLVGIISILFITGLFFYFKQTLDTLFYSLNLMFFLLILIRFRTYLKRNNDLRNHEIFIKNNSFNPKELPQYTVLIPITKNSGSFNNLFLSLMKMDYPKDKMEVIILVEESTRIKIKELFKLPEGWQLYTVPPEKGQSEIQIYNYGLQLASGKYITIYKNNHMPEPDQLKEAVSKFELSKANYFCLQAPLESAEASKSLFSNYLSIENSLKYNFFSYLDKGTYHYKVAALRNYGGWDLYNSAENLEIIRKAETKGYKIGILKAKTFQLSSDNFTNWFTQFVSSLKGYMQTLLVYNRNPFSKMKEEGIKDLLYNNLTIGGEFLTPFLYSLLLLTLAGFFINGESSVNLIKQPLFIFTFLNSLLFYLFNCFYILNSKLDINLVKRLAILPLIPVHWGTKSVAFLKAVIQLVKDPHYRTELKPYREKEEVIFMQINFLEKLNEIN